MELLLYKFPSFILIFDLLLGTCPVGDPCKWPPAVGDLWSPSLKYYNSLFPSLFLLGSTICYGAGAARWLGHLDRMPWVTMQPGQDCSTKKKQNRNKRLLKVNREDQRISDIIGLDKTRLHRCMHLHACRWHRLCHHTYHPPPPVRTVISHGDKS